MGYIILALAGCAIVGWLVVLNKRRSGAYGTFMLWMLLIQFLVLGFQTGTFTAKHLCQQQMERMK